MGIPDDITFNYTLSLKDGNGKTIAALDFNDAAFLNVIDNVMNALLNYVTPAPKEMPPAMGDIFLPPKS
jgi:hypothetical protein